MPVTDNLISLWKLDEASGNALDAHGTNDLTQVNSVGSTTGKIGNARDFESGSPAYFSIANNASIQVGDIDFTFIAWVNAESLTNSDAILGKWGGAESSYFLDYNASQFRFTVTDNGSGVSTAVSAGSSVTTATWYFVVAWHDATANTINIQVNNGTPVSAAHSTGVYGGTADFIIGYRGSGGLWDGLIDEVGFWKRVLTSDERTFLYNSGSGRVYEDFDLSPPVITTTTLPDGEIGTAYSETLAATGGTGAITWSVTAGALPDGLSINSSTGEISGTPTVADTFAFTVEAEDTTTATDTQALSITIDPAPLDLPDPYHTFAIQCSVKEYDEAIGFSVLKNPLSDGYRSRTLFGSNAGLRTFRLSLPTLTGSSASTTVTGINGEVVTKEEYLWALYCECEATGAPFILESFRNGQYYLVEFVDGRLTYSRFLTKLYSTGIELTQVRIDGVTVFDVSRVSGLFGFWDADTLFDGDDWDGTNGSSVMTLVKSGDVVTALDADNGHYFKEFNSTSNNGSVSASGLDTVYDVIMAVKFREATFSNNAAIFGGATAHVTGDSSTTKFTDPDLDNFYYSLNGTEYDANNMQAPMNEWGIVHFRNLDGWDVSAGFKIGADSGGNYAEMDLGDVVVLNKPSMITCQEIIEHLIIKYRTARGPLFLPPPSIYLGSEINHVIGAGQSLMVGGKGEPAISLTQPYSNLTFTEGVRSYTDELDTLIPLVESDADTWEGTDRGETPMSGAVNYVTELTGEPAGHAFLASTAARGGTGISLLKKGGTYYFLFEAQVQGGFDRAGDDTKTYELQAVLWGQGETDQASAKPYQTYKDELIQLRSDYEADAQAISGQTQGVPMICYQVTAYVTGGTHGVPLAQLDASVEDADIYLATPLYPFPFFDSLHLTNIGYLWLGHYFGKVFYNVVNWSSEWNPVRPKNISIVGTTVTVEFYVPVTPLVLDTTLVGATTDSGFSALDDSGAIGISSVAVTAPDTVEIELESTPGTNPRLRYGLAYTPTGSGTHQGGGGNLRDSDPASFVYDTDTYNLYNWCVLFEKPIPFTTESEAPTVPANLAAVMVSDTEIDLDWDAATDNIGVTQYWLQRATDAGFTSYVTNIVLGNVTSYSDTGLAPDIEYFYRVRAGDANNNFSAYSTADSATTDTNAFVPSDETGMEMWLDIDDLALSDDDPVATWADASGNANDATQVTAGDRPVFKTNIAGGKPVVRFDGGATGNYLDLVDLSSLTEGEVFIVVKADNDPATDANGGLWTMGTSTAPTLYPYHDGGVLDDCGSTVRKTQVDPATPLNQFNVYSVYSAAGDWASYINGVLYHSTASNTVGFSAAAQLGISAWTNQRFDGDVGDLIVFDHKLSAGVRTSVVNYLRSKYKIGS